MPANAPVYATLAQLGEAIQRKELDEYFFIQPDPDGQNCRLRYNNPNKDDNYNSMVNEQCAGLFVWTPQDQKIFEQCVSFNIPTKANPVRTGEASI